MKTTLITLLLSITLFSCQEYSDEDYLLLEANYERALQRDKELITNLQSSLNSATATVRELNREISELHITADTRLTQYTNSINELQAYYEAQIVELTDTIMELYAQEQNVTVLQYNSMYNITMQTIAELEALKMDYQEALSDIFFLQSDIDALRAYIATLEG